MNKLLKDLNLKKSYDPSIDGSDIINDFYIPCLSASIRYDRCSAYFSSAVLRQFSKGLENFYYNKGHIRFIFSCEILEEEMINIINAYAAKMDYMADSLDNSLENSYELANLSYLIKHNLADVKIAFMIKNKSALMHIKSGLFEDECGNKIYFDGSGNETEFGILKNAEIFNVFNNFTGDDYYVKNGENRFEQLWNNTYSPSTIRTEFPIGKLFEKLKSYNKEKIFKNQEEFFFNEDCVYIDIDIEKQRIYLTDYTNDRILQYPMVIKTIYGNKISCVGETLWFIEKLTLHDLRDIIPERICKYGKKIIYSPNAEAYVSSHDLKIDKRIKLAESIKTKQNYDIWKDDFIKFKEVINHEMVATLKEKQFENAYHHFAMKSSMDFSVPGTGKTYIAYGLFSYLYSSYNKNQDVNRLVVFGPLNCFRAWKEECSAIFGYKHNFSIFDITEFHKDCEKQLEKYKYNVYLFNYDFLTDSKIKIIAKEIINDKTMIVFDEIHKLKSLSGVRANNVIRMLELVKNKPVFKLALTGTPLPNSYTDLYNYLKILYSDDLNGFLKAFSVNQLKQADSNQYYSKEIQKNLHPLYTRTTKKDLNIPLANDDDLSSLSVNPTEDESKLYELIHKSYQNPLLKFIRLIQASSNPRLLLSKINIHELNDLYDDDFSIELNDSLIDDNSIYIEEEKKLINKIGISSKTKKTIELIVNKVNSNEKIIIWCLFIDTIDLLREELEKKGINCITISGRDNIKTRDDKINIFKGTNVDVLITNPNTLAESVSLHHKCHNAIYLEYGFNLTYLLQSKDRIHRVGLKEGTETNYYFSITKNVDDFGSIDTRIYERLQIKSNRMKETIESNDLILIKDLTDLDDIKYILKIR